MTDIAQLLGKDADNLLQHRCMTIPSSPVTTRIMIARKRRARTIHSRYPIGIYGSIVMTDIAQLLGKDADNLLQHRCMTIPSDQLYLPGHDYVDRVMIDNNRPPAVLRNMQTLYNTGRLAGTGYLSINMQTLYNTGRLAGTGYLSILPVDQGVEHSAGASFAANPLYFDPKNIVELAIEAGCNCVASTYGVLASVSRRYCRLTRALSTLPELHLPLTRSTLTRKTLLNWRSKRAVTVWRQLTACWHRYRGVTRIAFHSSSNLITTRR